MFIHEAMAQTEGAAQQGQPDFTFIIMMVLIFAVFYFLLIRPQQKKMKQHKEMLGAVRRGDKIVTGGGIIGTVTKVIDDSEVQVEISENVRVRVSRQLISTVLSKTQPAGDSPSGGGGSSESGGGSGGGGAEEGGGMLKKLLGGKK